MRTEIVLRALGVGAATGLRTMAAPTAVFRGKDWHELLVLGACGELVVDKLPFTPSRTGPGGLLARAVAAACAAGTVAARAGDEPATGAVIGVAGALAAAYLGAAYRAAVARATFPDLPAALLEDALAYATAFRLGY